MSESRQRFTGRMFLGLLLLIFLWFLFDTLPLFTRYLHISTIDPRWLTPEDLTWKRLLFNFLSKPGFRAILVMVVGIVPAIVIIRQTRVKGKKSMQFKNWNYPLTFFSLEWVIDGRKKSSMAEYGRFVGVI